MCGPPARLWPPCRGTPYAAAPQQPAVCGWVPFLHRHLAAAACVRTAPTPAFVCLTSHECVGFRDCRPGTRRPAGVAAEARRARRRVHPCEDVRSHAHARDVSETDYQYSLLVRHVALLATSVVPRSQRATHRTMSAELAASPPGISFSSVIHATLHMLA